MQIKTKVNVTHLDLNKLLTGGSREGVVIMVIGSRNLVLNEARNEDGDVVVNALVEVTYGLIDDQGRALPTIDGGIFKVGDTAENPNYVTDLSDSIAAGVTAGKNLIEVYDSNVLAMAKIKLAEIYGIKVTDVELDVSR